MGAWIRSKPSWWWPWGTSHWTFSEYLPGNEDPNKPPPPVADKATPGPAYVSPNGHRYATWLVPSPNGQTIQQGVDWSQKLD